MKTLADSSVHFSCFTDEGGIILEANSDPCQVHIKISRPIDQNLPLDAPTGYPSSPTRNPFGSFGQHVVAPAVQHCTRRICAADSRPSRPHYHGRDLMNNTSPNVVVLPWPDRQCQECQERGARTVENGPGAHCRFLYVNILCI